MLINRLVYQTSRLHFQLTILPTKPCCIFFTEAEYVALSDYSKQVVWIHTIMEELGYFLEPIPICRDNQGSIFMADNLVTASRSKHINLQCHDIRDYVKEGLIEIFYVKGTKNPADMFTKNLGQEALNNCRQQLGLILYDKPQS